jgi:hypothetical protein
MARKFKRGYQPEVVTEPKNEEATETKEIKSDTIEIIPQPEPVIEVQPEEPEITIEGEPKAFHHEFQDEYFLGTPSDTADEETKIDTLPEPEEKCVCEESCVCEEPCTEPCVCVEEKTVVEAPKQRNLESLSPAQLKAYQRTGFLPK